MQLCLRQSVQTLLYKDSLLVCVAANSTAASAAAAVPAQSAAADTDQAVPATDAAAAGHAH